MSMQAIGTFVSPRPEHVGLARGSQSPGGVAMVARWVATSLERVGGFLRARVYPVILLRSRAAAPNAEEARLCDLLDRAIVAERRTGAAIERLTGTMAELQARAAAFPSGTQVRPVRA